MNASLQCGGLGLHVLYYDDCDDVSVISKYPNKDKNRATSSSSA